MICVLSLLVPFLITTLLSSITTCLGIPKLKKIKIKQIASSLRRQPIQKKNLIGLGLNKVNKVVELEDTPSIRGMMNKVDHLIDVISEE